MTFLLWRHYDIITLGGQQKSSLNLYLKTNKRLIKIIDKIDINKLGIQHQFNEEIERYYKFNKGILGKTDIDFDKQKEPVKTSSFYFIPVKYGCKSVSRKKETSARGLGFEPR